MEPQAWNLSWRNMRYTRGEYARCDPEHQRLNHFKASGKITRKDKLMLALRKMLVIHGRVCNFSPTSFILPNEYTKFVHQFSEDTAEGESSVWICKPADMSRGRKIFLIKDLSELHYDQQYVIQKYVADPLTIGGYKLDLRVYVLVTSFQPLRVYVYEDGLCRFGTEKYDANLQEIGNLYSHLTNSSINKHSSNYSADKDVIGPGCKWDFTALRKWFETSDGAKHRRGTFERVFDRICDVVTLTLLAALDDVSSVENNQACFELFGFDILLDQSLKPWLIEVNCAPALGVDCAADRAVKEPMIGDLVDALEFVPYKEGFARRAADVERKRQQSAIARRKRRSLSKASGSRATAAPPGSATTARNRASGASKAATKARPPAHRRLSHRQCAGGQTKGAAGSAASSLKLPPVGIGGTATTVSMAAATRRLGENSAVTVSRTASRDVEASGGDNVAAASSSLLESESANGVADTLESGVAAMVRGVDSRWAAACDHISPRYGKFRLVFPFNAVTDEAAEELEMVAGRSDSSKQAAACLRTIVSEIRHRTKENRASSTATRESGSSSEHQQLTRPQSSVAMSATMKSTMVANGQIVAARGATRVSSAPPANKRKQPR